MNIVLEKVVLRRLEPRDVEQLLQYRNDWEAIQSLAGFSKGYSTKDLENWVEFHRQRNDEVLWAIADRQDDRCIGHVGFYQIDHRVRGAEFAILIGDKSWWGKGIGAEVSRAVLDYGFQQLNLHRVELSVLPAHAAAIHLYRKLGFKQEGCRRHAQFRDGQYTDIWIMGLLEDERGRK